MGCYACPDGSALVLEVVRWVLAAFVLVVKVAIPLAGDAMLGIGRGPYWGAAPALMGHVSDSVW